MNSKLTLNLGLRWEYATPRWERDNVLSNFDPATNTMIQAKNGSLYDRALVNPDYKDWAPRLGFAYTHRLRRPFSAAATASATCILNRLGSADELGINGPQVVIGTINQSPLLANGQPNPAFITTQSGFPATLASPASFNPVNANVAYIPQGHALAVRADVVRLGAARDREEHGSSSWRTPAITACGCRSSRTTTRRCRMRPAGRSACSRGGPIQSFGAITWVDPAGFRAATTASRRASSIASRRGLYLLNSFTWSKALGNSEQALETISGQTAANPQNIYNLSAERGPSSFDVKLMNVTSIVYQLPFGRGRKFGSSVNGVVDAVLGGWELNTIHTANTGLPVNVIYTPSAANDGPAASRIIAASPCSVRTWSAIRRARAGAASIDQYFNKARSRSRRPMRLSATSGGTPSARRTSGSGISGVNKNFRHPVAGGHGAAVPVGVLQRPEPHELRRAERGHHQRGIRNDSRHVCAAADSVRVETAVLMRRRALLDCSRAAVIRISLVVDGIMRPQP